MSEIRLIVATCSSRDVKAQTASSLVNLTGWLIHTGDKIGLTQLDAVGGVAESLLSAARQRKLNYALEGNFTHIAMFDDDMTFPKDIIHRFLSHDKDFVCTNVCQKKPNKTIGVCLDLHTGERISVPRSGLEEVAYGTLSCALIKLDAIRHIAAPHFEVIWQPLLNNGKGGYQGEDHYFMKKLRENGIKLYCDHDVAREVKHVGDFPYGLEHEDSSDGRLLSS